MATKKIRLLTATAVASIVYPGNSVLIVNGKVADELVAQGSADSHKDAVAYCERELGIKAVKAGEEPVPVAGGDGAGDGSEGGGS